MTTIAEPDWQQFVDDLSRSHQGWTADLDVRREDDAGTESLIDDEPFRGLALYRDDHRIRLIGRFGDDPDAAVAINLDDARDLAFVDSGDHCTLLIGSAQRGGWILELAAPGAADG